MKPLDIEMRERVAAMEDSIIMDLKRAAEHFRRGIRLAEGTGIAYRFQLEQVEELIDDLEHEVKAILMNRANSEKDEDDPLRDYYLSQVI